MTTPAVNKQVETPHSSLIYYQRHIPKDTPYGVIGSVNLGFPNEALVRKRPESVTHPVREDGTRAPGAWNHLWWYHNLLTGPYEWMDHVSGSLWRRYWSGDAIGAQMGRNNFSNLWLYGPGTTGWFPIGVEQAARTAVLNKMRKSEFQLGVTLAEAGKTVSLLRHTAETIVGGIKSFRGAARMSGRDFRRFMGEMRKGPRPFHYNPVRRRGRGPFDKILSDPRRMSREIPERWLEYTYGWKPLINDVDNAGQALCKLLFDDEAPMDFWARAGNTDVDDLNVKGTNTEGNSWWKMEWPVRVTSTCHYSIRYRAAKGVPADARDTLGLGLASTLWELTPYSFALDWVVGVGDWLDSMGVGDIADFVEGSRTYIQRIAGTDDLRPVDINSRAEIHRLPTKAILAGGRMQREVLGSLPVPAFVPPIRNKLGLPQLASLMSLLVQSGAKPYNRT